MKEVNTILIIVTVIAAIAGLILSYLNIYHTRNKHVDNFKNERLKRNAQRAERIKKN